MRFQGTMGQWDVPGHPTAKLDNPHVKLYSRAITCWSVYPMTSLASLGWIKMEIKQQKVAKYLAQKAEDCRKVCSN